MATVRNPLAGFAITIFGALALAFLAGIPILFLPQAELVYFYLPFALFGVGMLSGRSGFLGTLGFVGGTLGGFVGIYVFQTLFVSSSESLDTPFDVAFSRIPSHGAPLPSLSRDAMISRTLASDSSGSRGGSSFAGAAASTTGSPGAIGSRYSGSRYRRPSASIAVYRDRSTLP